MDIEITPIKVVQPAFEMKATLTRDDLVMLYHIGNYSSQIAALLEKKVVGFSETDYSNLLLKFYYATDHLRG